MSVYQKVILPLLLGLAAILVSVAAIVVIVGEVRGGDDADTSRSRASALEAVVPALRGFGGSLDALPEQFARIYLGVTVAEADGAVVVQSVLPHSPAAEAGVQAGDTVRAVNGTTVATVNALREALAEITDGAQYTVEIARAGAEQSVSVQRMTLEDALRAGIGGAFERFRDRAPGAHPSKTPRPTT